MKTDIASYTFFTPQDSGPNALLILQKPLKGAPFNVFNIPNETDVIALRDFLNQAYPVTK